MPPVYFPASVAAFKEVKEFFSTRTAHLYQSVYDINSTKDRPHEDAVNLTYKKTLDAIDNMENELYDNYHNSSRIKKQYLIDKLNTIRNHSLIRQYTGEWQIASIDSYNSKNPTHKLETESLVVYFMHMEYIIKTFREVINRYLNELSISLNHDENGPLKTEQAPNEKSKKQKILRSEKIKVRLTVNQLIYFFDLLQHSRLIENRTRKQIADFFSANFYNDSSEELSPKHIQNSTNEISRVDAFTVNSFLKKMVAKISKDYK